MAILQTRDLDSAARQLTAWLVRQLPAGANAEVFDLEIPQGAGHSNETILFEARWRESGAERRGGFVARIRPGGRAVFPEYDMQLQYRCMHILGTRTSIPVPRVLWFEASADVLGQPFYVMEKVSGQVPSDNPPYAVVGWLAEASPVDQAELWRRSIGVLARIHQLDWRALGFDFLDRPQFGATGFEQQLGYYRKYLPWASAGSPPPALSETFAWLEKHRPAESGPVVLNWGDARISNMMYRAFSPVAVLDWEMACLGPAEVDLAWFIFMNHFLTAAIGIPGLPGFPDRDATAAEYSAVAGRPVGDLQYYTVWAAFRFAVIMVAIDTMMVEHGMEAAGASTLALTALASVRDGE
ncbi:MAG TPA: phosphotransferase family protein [Candidatus Bathyarchaeia archaeon]|nr:phosphotransferase family protein [Candidatus Bathyarchaeia archaeon]